MSKNIFNLCFHIQKNTQNPNPIFKISISYTNQNNNTKLLYNFRKMLGTSFCFFKNTKFFFFYLCRFHNSYFANFVIWVICVILGIFVTTSTNGLKTLPSRYARRAVSRMKARSTQMEVGVGQEYSSDPHIATMSRQERHEFVGANQLRRPLIQHIIYYDIQIYKYIYIYIYVLYMNYENI